MSELFNDELRKRLMALAVSSAEKYRSADPFPHIVFDDFLPAGPLKDALCDFPRPGRIDWFEFDNGEEKKLSFDHVHRMPDSIREVLFFLNSPIILEFLETLTGIKGLIADPYFWGGGLHQIERGGHLAIHADFNKYERLNIDRRLNLIIYMNEDWKDEYGGYLELWDRGMTRAVRRVLPVFNRAVVFNTTDFSYHGHPEPLSCPKDRTRKSLATYYFTNGRPLEEQSHDHSTIFRKRPGVRFEPGYYRPSKFAKQVLRAIMPPVVSDALRFLKTQVRSKLP
jgi:Rps23 Pro-64 3,4-dihydroxylase Tpa1-like proline 4-hydroxylase